MRRNLTGTIIIGVTWCVLAAVAAPAHAQYGATNGEWPTYAGDLGGTKYSPLDQIDATNFSDLEIAWRWASPDGSLDLDALREARPEIGIRNFKATPLMVGGTVYISTPLVQSAAIDAGTGETRWIYNPESYLSDPYPHAMVLSFNSRGLAYWTDGNAERLFYGTNDGYLLAVDAKTGRPVRSFGDDGRVDLMEGIPRAVRGTTDSRGYSWLGVASPPIVAHDVVVTPTIISDLPIAKEAPPGWVKGIDARTVTRSGRFAPCRRATTSAPRAGRTNPGATRATPTSGRCSASTTKPDTSTCRPARPRATTTAGTGSGTTSLPRAWSRSTSRPGSGCGTSRRCTTGVGL